MRVFGEGVVSGVIVIIIVSDRPQSADSWDSWLFSYIVYILFCLAFSPLAFICSK